MLCPKHMQKIRAAELLREAQGAGGLRSGQSATP